MKSTRDKKRKRKWLRSKNLKNTFIFLYVFSVLIPVIMVDLMLIFNLNKYEKQKQKSELEISESAVISKFTLVMQQCMEMASNISNDKPLEDFLTSKYDSKESYQQAYDDYYPYCSLNYYKFNSYVDKVTIYTDNPAIENEGEGEICRLTDEVRKCWWYKKFNTADSDVYIFEDLSRNNSSDVNPYAGTISIVRKMNMEDSGYEGVILVDLDYSQLDRYFLSENSGDYIYICCDNRIVFSNNESIFTESSAPVIESIDASSTLVKKNIPLNGQQWTVVMKEKKLPFWETVFSSKQMILLLLFVNLFLPTFVIKKIVRSILNRLGVLEQNFDSLEREEFLFIDENPDGDEIDRLFCHYNQAVHRIKELIEAIIKKNNEQHLMEVSRKQAELNALNIQVNPHFMYNTLECICMRSLIKGEKETAGVVRNLSALLRQMSKWNQDVVLAETELDFVKKYLLIQKYRFDERLSYETEIEEICKYIPMPKLTLVSFVENACVHGIEESIEGGKISVSIISEENDVLITIRDTGAGMSKDKLDELLDKLEHADINLLFHSKSTGVLNAYIRLKMHFIDTLLFQIESKESEGTRVNIRLKNILYGVREEV